MKKILFSMCMLVASVTAMAQSEKGSWNLTIEGYGSTSINKLDVTKDHDEAVGGDVAVTYSLSDNLAVGVASGYYCPTTVYASGIIPVMANVVLSLPNQSKFTPLVDVRAGYGIVVKDDAYKNQDLANYGMLQIMPGVSYRLSKSIDINAKAVYNGLYMLGDNEGQTMNSIGAKLGLTFHF